MKFSKTVLAVSLFTAIQSAYAQGTILNQDKKFSENVEIKIDENSSETDINKTIRKVGIEASDNKDVSIKITNDALLTILGDQGSLSKDDRLYGIASQKGSNLSIKGNSAFKLDTSSIDLRAIRANGNISIDGLTTLNLYSKTGSIYAIEIWSDANFSASGEELSIVAKSDGGAQIRGVHNWGGSVADFNSKKTSIHVESPISKSNLFGVNANSSVTNFNGDVEIKVVAGEGAGFGVNVECAPGDDTLVNFNGENTKILITGDEDGVGLRPSGGAGVINVKSAFLNILVNTQNSSALGTRVQYGASLKISNRDSVVGIVTESESAKAVSLLNATWGEKSKNDFQFGSTEIDAKELSLSAKGAHAFGLVNAVVTGHIVDKVGLKDGVFINADTTINSTSTSKEGISVGIAALNTKLGTETPKSKVIVSKATVTSFAQNGGIAYATYLDDAGYIELGTSRLTAVSDGGKAIGIYNNNGSVIKFTGDSFVQAETALQGNGTVNVESGAVLTLDGKINKDEWTGIINANGKLAYGVAESIATSDLANANDGTLLVLAGTELAGNVNVGTVVTRDAAATSNFLKVASDGTVLVRATESYDGTSPLIKVDSVRAEKGSMVHLLNAAAIAEGTKVFESNDADEDSLEDYLFTTDHFLKKVENNRIVGEKSANVFGSDLLIPNVVDAAVNAANNEGADRILGLTNKALTQAQSLKAIHQIALMIPASGAQSTAINVANLQLDVIDTHASKLAFHAEDKVGADLWIDLNGFLSKTNDYTAGSAKFGYKSDLAGVTIGSDYSFGNGYAAGVSVAFGKGSVRGQGEGSGVKNDVDYYGVNLYGVWSNDYFNAIGSVGYLQTKNEIKTQGFKGKPDAKTVSVGVRFEKPLALNEAITVTPHLGVRYKHVKLDSFNAGGFKYTTEKADIVEVPFGVAFNANLKAPCGADVKPFIDLTIAPNFGDRKVSNKIALAGTTASDSFDARIANNAMYNAKVGVNAVKGSHTFGLNYGIGGGNRGRVDQTLQARYTYRF